jgi:hypothetical protein
MGRNDNVASAGASSVHVHMIVDGLIVMNLCLLMSPGCGRHPADAERGRIHQVYSKVVPAGSRP